MTGTGVEAAGDAICAGLKGLRFGDFEVVDATWDFGVSSWDERILVLTVSVSPPTGDLTARALTMMAIEDRVGERALPLLQGRMPWLANFSWDGPDDEVYYNFDPAGAI